MAFIARFAEFQETSIVWLLPCTSVGSMATLLRFPDGHSQWRGEEDRKRVERPPLNCLKVRELVRS